MAIVISKMDGTESRVILKSSPERELDLGDYIMNSPQAIPLYEIKEGKQLLLLARELTTGSGPIDALAVDNEGDVYIIETKLYKNPDKRRVIGQVLDYGAAFWTDPAFDQLTAAVRKLHGVSLDELIGREFSLDKDEIETLSRIIQQNFTEGVYKFIVLMDVLDERLKNLIMYMNQNTSFDIYGVELQFYEFDAYRIAVPRIVGTEVRKEVTRAADIQKWDEESWFESFESQNGQRLTNAIRRIRDMALTIGFRTQYSTQRRDERATMWLFFDYEETTYRILGIRRDGQVELRLSSLKAEPPFDRREVRLEFIERLNGIEGVELSTEGKALDGNPTFTVEVFEHRSNLQNFAGILEWVVMTIQKPTP
jgi:hypothetical protein